MKLAEGREKGAGGRGVDEAFDVDVAGGGSAPPISPGTGGAAATPKDMFISPKNARKRQDL